MSIEPILLAEDDTNDALLFKIALRQCRILNPLVVVQDGSDVISYLKGEGRYGDRVAYPLPAVLFLDLVMKRVGGLEVLEWLQNQPKDSFPFPVVMLTGFRELSHQMRLAYRMGAHTFLLKPVEKKDLLILAENLGRLEFGILRDSSPTNRLEAAQGEADKPEGVRPA